MSQDKLEVGNKRVKKNGVAHSGEFWSKGNHEESFQINLRQKIIYC